MKLGRILATATAAIAAVAVLPAVAAAASGDQTSSNWAGWAISDTSTIAGAPIAGSTTTLSFSSTTATWVQPRVSCTAGSPSYSAFWVGLGGLASDSRALEQVGTQANCNSVGKAAYTAWYEIVPAPSVSVKLKVVPGDVISASVNVQPNGILVQVKNRTRKTSFTKLLPMPAVTDFTSAEWIAEAPSSCNEDLSHCRTLPLANFGTVPFTRIAAIANTHPGVVTDSAWASTRIDLVPDAVGHFGGLGTAGTATPTAVDATGRAFSVAFGTS
ncbi:MAG TPA: G1 family glutamic endopeptidase [Gaiellaceae bacterium]